MALSQKKLDSFCAEKNGLMHIEFEFRRLPHNRAKFRKNAHTRASYDLFMTLYAGGKFLSYRGIILTMKEKRKKSFLDKIKDKVKKSLKRRYMYGVHARKKDFLFYRL